MEKRAELILNICRELKEVQPKTISSDKIRKVVNDTRKFLRGVEDEYKTNQ